MCWPTYAFAWLWDLHFSVLVRHLRWAMLFFSIFFPLKNEAVCLLRINSWYRDMRSISHLPPLLSEIGRLSDRCCMDRELEFYRFQGKVVLIRGRKQSFRRFGRWKIWTSVWSDFYNSEWGVMPVRLTGVRYSKQIQKCYPPDEYILSEIEIPRMTYSKQYLQYYIL